MHTSVDASADFSRVPNRADPGLSSHVVEYVLRLGLNVREHLDSARASTNQCHSLVRPVKLRIPTCCVHEGPFEGLQALDLGPLPLVEDTSSFNKDIGGICHILRVC